MLYSYHQALVMSSALLRVLLQSRPLQLSIQELLSYFPAYDLISIYFLSSHQKNFSKTKIITLFLCFKAFNDLERKFLKYLHAYKSSGDLVEMQILIWQVEDSAFLTSSRVMLLVERQHFEQQEQQVKPKELNKAFQRLAPASFSFFSHCFLCNILLLAKPEYFLFPRIIIVCLFLCAFDYVFCLECSALFVYLANLRQKKNME